MYYLSFVIHVLVDPLCKREGSIYKPGRNIYYSCSRVDPLYVNHVWPSHVQILMQLLIFVCFDMDDTCKYA